MSLRYVARSAPCRRLMPPCGSLHSHQTPSVRLSLFNQRVHFFRTSANRRNQPIPSSETKKKDLYENIYTWPNLITLSRIAATPLLGYFIVNHQTLPATLTLAYAGISDIVRLFLCITTTAEHHGSSTGGSLEDSTWAASWAASSILQLTSFSSRRLP